MAYKHINTLELSIIKSMNKEGFTIREISKEIKRSSNFVWRYLKRFKQFYSIEDICLEYLINKSQAGRRRIELDEKMKKKLMNKRIDLGWSVNVICGFTKSSKRPLPSKSTVYLRIKDKTLSKSLLIRKKKFKKRWIKNPEDKPHNFKTIRDLRKESKSALKKTRFGNWEGDTIVGKDHQSMMITLSETVTKHVIALKVDEMTSKSVADSIASLINKFPKKVFKTILFDQGREFSKWKEIEAATSTKVYFADAGCPGQRGLNEANNALLRRYFHKGSDLRQYSREEIEQVCNKINKTPRKILGYKKPWNRFKTFVSRCST